MLWKMPQMKPMVRIFCPAGSHPGGGARCIEGMQPAPNGTCITGCEPAVIEQ